MVRNQYQNQKLISFKLSDLVTFSKQTNVYPDVSLKAGFWLDSILGSNRHFFLDSNRLLARRDWIFPTRLDCWLDSIEYFWLDSIRSFYGDWKTITNFSFSSLKNALKVLNLKVLPTFQLSIKKKICVSVLAMYRC